MQRHPDKCSVILTEAKDLDLIGTRRSVYRSHLALKTVRETSFY
jgi:hypothetical protein